jgi:acyl-CoA thioester hydrolase
MGRVHHANYINYFEIGRTELLRSMGHSYRQVEEEGFYLVVAEISVRYLLPAQYDDLLTLRTAVLSARGARIEHEYQIFRGVELLATGRSAVACVDRQGRVRRLPAWLRSSTANSATPQEFRLPPNSADDAGPTSQSSGNG